MQNRFPYHSIKSFMTKDALEPNHHYRPWLEENIGLQNADWMWEMHSMNDNTLIVYFVRKEDAILFELTWP